MSMSLGTVAPSGALSLRILRGGSYSQVPAKELSFRALLKHGLPRPGLAREVFTWRLRNLPNFWRGLWKVAIARSFQISHLYGQVSHVVIKGDGRLVDYGLASLRVVTTAGVNFLVDALQGTVEPEILKYHGFGTGAGAEAAGDTALATELTTQYATDSTRPTGSLTEGASANIFRTVGTLSPDASCAITEHGVFSQAATGGGTLLDRSLFSAINLVSGDSLQTTYDFTITAGS